MNNTRYENFISKLITLTKEGIINWSQVPEENEEIVIKLTENKPFRVAFNNSFYFHYKNCTIVVFSLRLASGLPAIRIISDFNDSIKTESDFPPIIFDRNDHSESIGRLVQIIKSQFPTPEDLVDIIIELPTC